MKFLFIFVSILIISNEIYSMKLLSSSSRELNRREMKLVKRLVKRQIYSDSNCNRRECPTINCGKDFVAAALPGECCEKCVPWEYASSLGIQYPQNLPSSTFNFDQQRNNLFNSFSQQQQQRVDVYIFGPENGARVLSGQNIYFDCEIVSSYNQYGQPRWSRNGNQPLSSKVQTTILSGIRKLVRLTIPDATQSDAGRYECSATTGNPNDFASIDLQVIDSSYYPSRASSAQHPSYNPSPSASQTQLQPEANINNEENETNDLEDESFIDSTITTTTTTTSSPSAANNFDEINENLNEDEGEYPEDYTETE